MRDTKWNPSLLVLLILLFGSGTGRPHGGQRDLVLAAVKAGILSSLGMDEEPQATQKASEGELSRMYELYRETLRGLRGNSSRTLEESSLRSTVMLPTSVDELQREDQAGVTWYRSVFQRNPNIRTELTLTRARLKISMRTLKKLDRREDFRVNGVKIAGATLFSWNVSGSEDVTLDVRATVEGWMRTRDDGQPLVVDVGIDVEEPKGRPAISLELRFRVPKRKRLPRSNKEDECNEEGWCCRKSTTVSFKDIGWTDWIVAPAEYTMHLCDGGCPHNYKPASMHTQVKSRLHQIMKGETPRPCCVPAAYEPMVLMHYDSKGKLTLTRFDDFIVSKCHCA